MKKKHKLLSINHSVNVSHANMEPVEHRSVESSHCEPTPPIIVIPPSMKVYQDIYNKITHSVPSLNPVMYPSHENIQTISSSEVLMNRSIIDPNSIIIPNISTRRANVSKNKHGSLSYRSSRRVSHQKDTRKNKKN